MLIFSQFTSMLDILEVYMRIRQYSFRRLDGSTPVMDRYAASSVRFFFVTVRNDFFQAGDDQRL